MPSRLSLHQIMIRKKPQKDNKMYKRNRKRRIKAKRLLLKQKIKTKKPKKNNQLKIRNKSKKNNKNLKMTQEALNQMISRDNFKIVQIKKRY